jgi:hypothetical protein
VGLKRDVLRRLDSGCCPRARAARLSRKTSRRTPRLLSSSRKGWMI